jgi:branched-chain amino acid transport system ATP-binding protein
VTLLSVEGLEAGYGQLKAVRGVSLTIEKAETVALVGANGAGKTTLRRAASSSRAMISARRLLTRAPRWAWRLFPKAGAYSPD